VKTKKKKNLHHLTPRSRGGKSTKRNLLDIYIERHIAWHQLFRNRTLKEVISLLKRLDRLKKAGTNGSKMQVMYKKDLLG